MYSEWEMNSEWGSKCTFRTYIMNSGILIITLLCVSNIKYGVRVIFTKTKSF